LIPRGTRHCAGETAGRQRGSYSLFTPAVENGQPSALTGSVTAQVHSAMFKDACPFLQQAYDDGSFNITRCRSFGGGVMLQGLTAASEEWQRMAYNVADRKLRGGFIRGRLQQGEGYSMDSDHFDYPSMACNESRGCTLDRKVTIPIDGSALPPTQLPDESYTGDYNVSQVMPSYYSPYAIADELRRDQMDFVLEMDSRYLTPGLFLLAQVRWAACGEQRVQAHMPTAPPSPRTLTNAQMYRKESQDAINGYLNFISAFVPAYIVAFAALVRLRCVVRELTMPPPPHTHTRVHLTHSTTDARSTCAAAAVLPAASARHQQEHPRQAHHVAVPARAGGVSHATSASTGGGHPGGDGGGDGRRAAPARHRCTCRKRHRRRQDR
jgi:hypothetical protein